MKGISAVIATLLLLVITIGLAMTVYFYVNNLAGKSTEKVINIETVYCTASGTSRTISVVFSNVGTSDILDGDIKFILNSGNAQNLPLASGTSYPIQPRNPAVGQIQGANIGSNTLVIISPAGTTRQVVVC
ncbi:MAG: type IV pilin [Candidatus Aenigmatarchaeota archaeon]|nr:type IV pilin [Candidatus Aenigmarchaeota archaeon]